MEYFDSILNVYAYIKQKQTKNIENTRNMVTSLEQSESLLDEIKNTTDDYLLRANNLARQYGLDTISLSPTIDILKNKESSFNFEKIMLPDNYDYESEFEKLVDEARKAGFVNVHPEELLSADEMDHARRIDKELDLDFAEKTGLKAKDIFILCIAIALQITKFVIIKYINEQNKYEQIPIDSMIKDHRNNNYNKLETKPNVISADAGVDMAKILSSANDYMKEIPNVSSIFSNITEHTQDFLNIRIKNYNQILSDSVPFLINDDTSTIKKKDILGKDKYLGWIFGVFNIMTDTITLKSLKSFPVKRSSPNSLSIVEREISTVKDVFCSIDNYNNEMKKSVISAVLREAYVLMPSNVSYDDMYNQLEQSISLVDKIESLTPKMTKVMNINVEKFVGEASIGGLINAIIATIHSIQYKSEIDGEIDLYLIRTNKILVYSNAIATSCNSIPAIFSRDASDIDWSGVFLTLLQLVNSIRFWINIKTEFLISNQMKIITKELDKINQYFVY